MKTKEQLAKEYSNSVIDKIRKDRKEDPSHNIGYGDISEIAYKIGFDAGAKQMQEKCIEICDNEIKDYAVCDAYLQGNAITIVKQNIQKLMRKEDGDE